MNEYVGMLSMLASTTVSPENGRIDWGGGHVTVCTLQTCEMCSRIQLLSTLLVVVAVHPYLSAARITRCWPDYRECYPWYAYFMREQWIDCNTRCKVRGKSGGKCVKVPTTCFNKGKVLLCQCY